MLAIGYGRSEWLWADPIVLNFNRVPVYKEVNACQWSEARLCTNEMYEGLVRTRLGPNQTLEQNLLI